MCIAACVLIAPSGSATPLVDPEVEVRAGVPLPHLPQPICDWLEDALPGMDCGDDFVAVGFDGQCQSTQFRRCIGPEPIRLFGYEFGPYVCVSVGEC